MREETTFPCRSRSVCLPALIARAFLVWATPVMGILAASPIWAASSSNAASPVGINLAPVTYYSSEQPFLNIFMTNSGFSTQNSNGQETKEEQYLNLDSNGWPTSLTAVNDPNPQKFTQVSALVLRSSTSTPIYASGQYVVRYVGQGTLTYSFDAVKDVSLSTPGRDVINVANASSGGILVAITSTDPNHTGNYIRNIQLVSAAQESALLTGQMFNPVFLNLMQNFHTLRFMDWFQTNGSTLSLWSNRPLPANPTWASSRGVPYEVAVQLANAVSADAWINVPVMATNSYITQLATLVHGQLGTAQKAYVELSNEVWNSSFPQYSYAQAQGQAAWPNAGSGADYSNNWYGMRSAQTCDVWKSVWGADASRVVCVMGAQEGNPWIATERLNCALWTGTGNAPCAGHGIGAVAIAPYFGGAVPSAWTSQPDGGLSSLFAALTTQNDPSIPAGGFIAQALGWAAAYPSALAPYNLPLISYEGGQGFESFPNGVTSTGANNPLTNLYIAANRDPRMQAAYQTYLQGWKKLGGQLFMQFNDIGNYSQYGEWGALESIMQTTSPLSSAPPKWQALQNFISGTPCWWSGCTSAVVGASPPPVPMAPSNLTIH